MRHVRWANSIVRVVCMIGVVCLCVFVSAVCVYKGERMCVCGKGVLGGC